jgi:hypothetical protein
MSAMTKGFSRGVALGTLLAASSCALPDLPINEQTFRSDSDQVVGQLQWAIVECDTGSVLARGNRKILAAEVSIQQFTYRDGHVSFEKRVDLNEGFYFQMVEHPVRHPRELVGFGLTAGRDESDCFSWEWFNVKNEVRALKLQEGGELAIRMVPVEARWEVARTEVTSALSLRIQDGSITNALGNAPIWRIRLETGSYINWPTVGRDNVIVHQLNGASARPN